MSTGNSTVSGLNISTAETQINESIAPPIIQFLIGLAGNITAMVSLVRSSKEHKWAPFYRLIGGLISLDLLGIALLYPFALVRYSSKFTFDYPKPLCGFISFMMAFIFMTSALTVCVMSFDRTFAILLPLRYSHLSKGFKTNLTQLVIWILAAILCSLNLFGLGTYRSFYPGSWCFINFIGDDPKDKVNTYMYAVTGVIILIATVVLNAMVIYSVCTKICDGSRLTRKDKWNDIFIIVYLITIVTLFAVSWTPLMVRMLVNASSVDAIDGPIDLLAARLSVANSLINPWLYLLLRKRSFVFIARLFRSLRRRIDMVKSETDVQDNPTSTQDVIMNDSQTM